MELNVKEEDQPNEISDKIKNETFEEESHFEYEINQNFYDNISVENKV